MLLTYNQLVTEIRMYNRILQKNIEDNLFKGKVIILYGARQVGKTTLVRKILQKYDSEQIKTKYIDCDLIENRQALQSESADRLKKFLGNYQLIALDEAQRVHNIGINLKIIHDHYPEIQILATGSSSFTLANEINEPLTGRAFEYMLAPLSIEEVRQHYDYAELLGKLDGILRFGLYPDIFDKSIDEANNLLNNIANNYLYKDILEFENLRRADQLLTILQLLALQVGSEVSYKEIASQLGVNVLTIQRYISLLEKTFIIFRLRAFSRNLRKEISKSIKIYFWDLGIRNSLIKNFNELAVRNDKGALWKNFCIAERMKFNLNHQRFVNGYFWRTYDKKEIDYIEEANGEISAFEMKWDGKKVRSPNEFLKTYKGSKFSLITKDNFDEFVDA